MRLRLLAAFAATMISCGSGGPQIHADGFVDSSYGDVGADVITVDYIAADGANDGQSDLAGGDAADAGDTTGTDTAGTCEGILRSWMCGPDDCADNLSCAGFVQTCDQFPCWGLWCNFVPGACIPIVNQVPCSTGDDCGDGFLCVNNGLSGPGLCTASGPDGLCYSNDDCGTGRICAGEVVCNLGSPCQGPQYPGVCEDVPAGDGCWDDGMCESGWCDGANLCRPGDKECTAGTGNCVTGTAPACESQSSESVDSCTASPWGNWCIGDPGLGFGYCAPPPAGPVADGQCWGDSDCIPEKGSLCRSAMACPPRSYCRVSGFHAGFCGAAPTAGDGLTLRFADQTATDVVLTMDSKAVLINGGPVPVYVFPCQTIAVQAQRNGQWEDLVLDWGFNSPECTSPELQGDLLQMIPPGSGMVLSIPAGSTFNPRVDRQVRLVLDYWLGCEPGATFNNGTCANVQNGLKRSMYSADVLSKASN